MKKNMYSLMLSEDVISIIDRMAGEAGKTRSGFIDNVLAEYVSYRTPEMRINEMMDMLNSMFSPHEALQVMLRPSASTFSLRSALAFKYNPTINYNIELYRTPGSVVGEVRAGLRTQNSSLKLYIMQFYKLWAKIEASYTGVGECSIDGEKFVKQIVVRDQNISEDDLSEAIVEYVCAFDNALKAFFYNIDDTQKAVGEVEKVFRDYYRGADILI